MDEVLNTNEYFMSVANATRNIFDKISGKQYRLRSLFFLQRFAEGQHAFTRYKDLLEESESEESQVASSEIFNKLSQTLQQYSDKKQVSNIPSLPSSKKGYKLDVEELLSSITSSINLNQYNIKERNIVDHFLHEPRDLCNTLLFSSPSSSRVLIMANAGYGKTTLIQRIALALTDYMTDASEFDRKNDRSFLSSIEDEQLDNLVPCIISLRDSNGDLVGIDSLIVKSVISFIQNQYDYNMVDAWIKTVRNRLVLLIDGLDELPSETVAPFLLELEDYLASYPYTRVIITTRVSGIDNDEVNNILQRLSFRGRTILPLSDYEAKQFCEQWIQETNSSPDLMKSLERIQTESHLSYLREFIRKPLELVMLLQYLPHQSNASFNRWDLFSNILWAEITNHVKFENKQSVYDDECTLLSFLAFQMQIRNMQSLTFNELESLTPSIMKLNFYNDICGMMRNDNSGFSATSVWNYLKRLAQNLGIVETIESTKTVAIPLRSYQEYLVAYACCNLCLNNGESSPNPTELLKPYINNRNWLGVIGFVISGIECKEYVDLDLFLSSLYSANESTNSLCDLIEVDYYNSLESAKSLCRVKFNKYTLSGDEKRLLEKCMKSHSSFSFRKALSTLYRESFAERDELYLEAVSFAYLIEAIKKGKSPISLAVELLRSSREYEKNIGAELLILVSCVILGEEKETVDAKALDDFELTLPDDILIEIHDLAIATKSYIFVRALTELTISKIVDLDRIISYLDYKCLEIVCAQLYLCKEEIKRQFLSAEGLQEDYNGYLKNLVHTIGMFPYQLGAINSIICSPWILALVSVYYDLSLNNFDLDQIGIAVCKYHITGLYDDFIISWTEDICRGRRSSEVRKDHLYERENRHFLLIRNTIFEAESEYFLMQQSKLNRMSEKQLQPDMDTTELFKAGEDSKALELALRFYREGFTSVINNINLAFLVRFLKYDTEELFGVTIWNFLDAILHKGVSEHDPYATMNYALSLLERGDAKQAEKALQALNSESLQRISGDFWYPIMWKKRETIEGAFVCILAEQASGVLFPEHEDMLNIIKKENPQLLQTILI